MKPIRYAIVPKHPAAHLFEVTLTLADPDPAGQRFSLPTWIPGSYLVREFARNIVTVSAFNEAGRKVRIETLNQKAGQIDAKARGEQISGDHQTEPINVDDEHFLWKFNGEYWKDELGFYRFKIRSRCPKK